MSGDLKEIASLTAHELARRIRHKEISPTEAVKAVSERIRAADAAVGAYLDFDGTEEARALEEAGKLEARLARGEDPGPLAGVPVAVKDNILVAGRRTECASKILRGFVGPYDATVVTKLRSSGAIPLGRTNMDEFAMGSSTEHSVFHTTRNPWSPDRIPGGSSGGSAAAVAAHEAILAIGSDTGGSIRQPAACCGVVGMKPTYGRVSRYGLVAFGSSLDQIGPLAKDVEDAALALAVIAGEDPRDLTSLSARVPNYQTVLKHGVAGLRIGAPREYFSAGLDPEVKDAVWTALEALEDLGATVEEVTLPHTEYATAVYYLVATAEASANLARFDGVRYGSRVDGPNLGETYFQTRGQGFGPEVKRRIMLGTYALSSGYYDAYYLRAQKVRTLIRKDFDTAFHRVDVLVTPTTPTPAFKAGEKLEDPLQMYLSDICTISCNLAGLPGISLPCGFTKGGGAYPADLPIGLQILAPALQEEKLFRVAAAYESATAWRVRRPAVAA